MSILWWIVVYVVADAVAKSYFEIRANQRACRVVSEAQRKMMGPNLALRPPAWYVQQEVKVKVIPNITRNPLQLIEETETWLLAEARQVDAVLGETPLVIRLRGRAHYLRNVREALTRAAARAA